MAPTLPNMNAIVGSANVLFLTFDCLRFDVAQQVHTEGRTPTLTRFLPPEGWEPRETPGTFTLPAHLAFFHGFLPTPMGPGPHPRLFALEFEGSLTIAPQTYVFAGVENILAGFHTLGYRSFCVGGVGFFNKLNPLGHVLPGFFEASIWDRSLSVSAKDSTEHQVRAALDWLARLEADERFFLFLNISATHPPHAHFVSGAERESVATQKAALAYVDRQMLSLLEGVQQRGDCFCLMMGDHGEAYGEDGRWGHRLAHPTVTTVPYTHFLLRAHA